MIVILSLIVVLFGSGVSLANAPIMDKPRVTTITKQDIQMWVREFSQEYGASNEELRETISVGFCESGFNHNAVGDSGKSINVFQWQEAFWQDASNRLGEELDRNSAYDQAKLTTWIFANGTESDKRKWTSYRALVNGGEYTFYSKIEKKSITVRCNYQLT